MTAPNYSFRIEQIVHEGRVIPKICNLIYEEEHRKLVVELETSGVPRFDLGGCDISFQRWTEPVNEAIPANKQAEILKRLAEWSQRQHLRISIGPSVDMKAFFEQQEKEGFKVERRADGTILISPPRRKQ